MSLQVLMSNVTADGPGSALNCIGRSKAVVFVSGRFTANVSFEASLDGVTYFSFSGRPNGGSSLAAVVSAPGYLEFDVGGIAYLRPVVSRYESGTVTVHGYVDSAGGNVVYDGTASWPNSAEANTIVDLDVVLPEPLQEQSLYVVVVYNPSAVTGLAVSVKGKETFGSAVYPVLTSFAVEAGASKQVLVQGWLVGEGGRLSLSNDTVLGASDGFTAYVRIRQV